MTTEIDYQVLRDVSERAITAMTHLSILPGDDDLLSEKKLNELGIDIDAIHAFKIMAGPETVLALLDERDASNERMAELEANLAELAEDQQKAIESIKQADSAVKLAHEKFSALAAENARLKSDAPLGAIENGRAFADRLENYQFECEDGNLNMCSDWQEFRRCFEYLSEWAMHSQTEHPATDAFLAEVRAQGVEMFAECAYTLEHHDHAVAFAAELRKGGNQ
ncbi:ead/Ea22-like family protein [Escherichia coli]|nr:ead/Ea22-like family protein [Escherichia coli]